MKQRGKRLGALLLAAAMLLSLLPVSAFAAAGDPEGQPLISPGLTVTASDEEAPSVKERAIDNDLGTQWSSGAMKNGTDANQTQTPQWLTVDLGAGRSYPISIDSIRLDYNMMVWPMVYRIETSANGTDGWTTLVSVSRDPYNGGVHNGAGQNIASQPTGDLSTATTSGENYDLITKTSSPALAAGAAVQRYVRFYVEKVNTLAGGNNTGLREIQIYAPNTPVEPIEGAWNLALNQPAEASGHDGGSTADKAVDGNTSNSQWSSANMKTGGANADPNAAQTPQWLWVDLGATGSRINQIKLWYNVKVWPMVYEIQTTDDDPNSPDAVWERVVRVERSPYDGWVQNGTGQNIADQTNNTDTITVSSTPALQMTTLKRYVRFYAEKVNTKAAGDNTGLREIEIYGVNPARANMTALLDEMNASEITATGAAVSLPTVDGATLSVRGSVLENVVANDGAIGGRNITAKDVTLLVRATNGIGEYAEKNFSVTVPAHRENYPAAWFSAVTNANAKPEVIPAIQEWYGYTGSFTLTEGSRIIINDAANVGLQKAAQNMQADVLEISGINLPIVTGTSGGAGDIYIESLTADSYDLGKEGYLMRVSDEGIKIYAPTYTGCIFGTITVEQILWQAEDHLSVPKGIMRDYPAYEVRGIKLDIGRAPYRYQQLQDYAKIMLWYKMSEYDLHINDTENPNASNATDSQNNIGFHRLESDTFPSLKLMDGVKRAGVDANLVDADYYNDPNGFGGNPVYTKQQWRELTELVKDYGMYLLTEIDMPGHALAYNRYVDEYPEEAAAAGITGPIRSTNTTDYRAIELLDLTGANAENALKFAKALWDEYTRDDGDGPTIYGNVVHIGADEYWVHNEETNNAFAVFADEMRQVIQGNLGEDTKIRMWGATGTSFSTATTVLNKTHAELAEDYQLEVWANGYDNAAQRAKDGYEIINCRDCFMYGNPGRTFRDVPNAEYLFNSWDPTMFGGNNPMLGEPNLIGAKAVIWGEQTQEGLTERDVHQRVLRAIAIVSEKTWGGETQSEGTFSDYELRFNRLAEGPGTQIAMEVSSETSLVLDYDFNNVSSDGTTIYDASGNGYDASLTGGTVDEEGWLAFDGSTLLTTGLKTLPYPYTVSFDLKAGQNDDEASLFSGYDGRIQVAGHNGHMSANNGSFIRDFNYAAPTDGTAVNITIVGTMQALRLYVNGELKVFLSQKEDKDGVSAGVITSYFSSVPLPLEKIGQDFHGELANIKVYNKAFSAQEVADAYAGTDDNLVNVAQNAIAGGDSYQPGDPYDNAVQRICIAAKAIDGEAFTDNTDASSEMWSYWRGDHADSALTVDLGQVRRISRVDLQWRTGGIGNSFKIQTSLDGKSWTDATTISGNTNARQTITLSSRTARFIRLQGVSGTYNLQEMLVYENVKALKDQLAHDLAEAEEVVEYRELGFESVEAGDRADFADVVFARAVLSSPLSTRADVEEAIERLSDQLFVRVTDITLDPVEATIYTNEDDPNHTVELTATVGPEGATNKGITWTTSSPAVATVHEGVVTGNGVGTATITATAADGSEVYATCTVTVKTKLVYNIEITGDAKYDSVLTVQLNQLQMPEEDLNRMTFQWYWVVDGEKVPIDGATEQSYRLVEEDIGKTISVVAIPADPYEGNREASMTGTVERADGLRLVATPGHEDCVSGNDGKITGLFKGRLYEYRLLPSGDWIPFSDLSDDETGSDALAGTAEITGLAPGDYRVRRAETDTYTAGEESYTITILSAENAANAHDVNIPRTFEGGRVLSSTERALEGAVVVLSIVSDEGRELAEGTLTVTRESGAVIEVTPVDGADNDYMFEMPDEDVTVAAEFTTRSYTITHALENVNCSLEGEHSHTVLHGDTPVITLTPEEGYQVPANIQIINTDTNEVFKAYTYRYNTSRDRATITISGGVTANLTISGEGVRIIYPIAHDLDNLVCSLPSNGHRVAHGAALSITLTPSDGFLPPKEKSDITITMGGLPFSDFDYAVNVDNTGTITIDEGKITGSLEFTAAAVRAVPALSVELDMTSVSLNVGETVTLSATVHPAGAIQAVIWESGNSNVASVDEYGVVTAVAAGDTVITATTVDGGLTITCTVTVTSGVPDGPGETTLPTLPPVAPDTTTTVTKNEDGSTTTTVTDNKTGAVTATTVDPEGGKVEKVTAADGNVTITVTDPDGSTVVSMELPGTMPTLPEDQKFVDVPDSNYAAEAINSMAALGIVNGVGDRRFDRTSGMKRGDLAAMLYRMSNGGTGYDLLFEDVPSGKYYADGIAWAAEVGVVTGYSESVFAPEETITREQLAVMLYRYAKLLKLDTASSADALDDFTDGSSTHGWAVEGTAWCVENGILQGRGNGILDPRSTVIRADVALMLQRFIDLLK